MKSIKSHFSLVLALLSILFSLQVFTIVDRSIDSYKLNLTKHYSLVVVSQKKLTIDEIQKQNKLIDSVIELSPDSVINRLNKDIDKKNIELLRLSLPKFYKLTLKQYPTPQEIKQLNRDLLKHASITKVEDFSNNHDTVYKMLLLFKNMVFVFAISIFTVTSLLIFKELRIWQFKHSERMSIMGLFGAPVWLRSAVLFRLAIVDAIIATFLAIGLFLYFSSSEMVLAQFQSIGVEVLIFDFMNDSLILFGVAISLSILLALLIVAGHKEEV